MLRSVLTSLRPFSGLAAVVGLLLTLIACNPPPSEVDLNQTRGGRVEVFFNEPGTRKGNMWHPDVVSVMIDMVDNAQVSIDFAVMGFTYRPLAEAFIRAYERGVTLRMVGHAGHLQNIGYHMLRDRQIPVVVGNQAHIMHNKFMVVDSRFLFAGTANWSRTDLIQNSNNSFVIDSPAVAADFTQEFEQLFSGVFGFNKVEQPGPRVYQVGDTEVEVWFSPNEDGLGRMLEIVDGAEESVRFTIFAFTKDQVGSSFIRKQAEFQERDLAEGFSLDSDFRARRSVAGVIDRSQLHSNGQYHEVYRLLGAKVPMVEDGNDNSSQPGDYQAGGGRLHSKTMLIDVYGENPTVISGSFNWSAAATQSNDEFLMVFHGERLARQYDDYFESLWANGKRFGIDFIGEKGLSPGDIVFNEVLWYGVHANDPDGYDEFIELRNTTDRDIRLDMWQIANDNDFIVGMPPGSLIKANSTFLILDHTRDTYIDGEPQGVRSAFTNGDLVLNPYNDNRQARLYLKDGALGLSLLDPKGVVVDRAGNGGPAFAGGPRGGRVYSMERRDNPGDGALPSSWKDPSVNEGGVNVNDPYRNYFMATPGEANSP